VADSRIPPMEDGSAIRARFTTRHLVLVGASLIGVSTAAVSAVSLYSLAMACAIPRGLAAALPIALDAGAAVATVVWVTETGTLRKLGRLVALAALFGTLAGNTLSHLVTADVIAERNLWLIIGVSPIIPAMLAATAHLLALMFRAEETPARKAAPVKAKVVESSVEQAPLPRPAKLHLATPPVPNGKPWGPRAQELKRAGTAHSTAYRQAEREWKDANPVGATS
jgi:hypothetical protein